jgi:hypothetical protein
MLVRCQWDQLGLGHGGYNDVSATKCTWLGKVQNFECVPSNFSRRLICSSFVWSGVIRTHLNDVDVWIFCKWTTKSQSDWFFCHMCLNAARIYSMDMIISSFDIYMITKTCRTF